jgi:Electron transfer DM13
MTATPVIDRDESKPKRRWKRPLWIGLATAFVVVVVVVLVVFQPQKLFFDDHVDEAVPVAVGPEPAEDANPDAVSPPAVQPMPLLSGNFISRDHGTSGVANILDIGGTSYLRIEDLDTDNGPDLYVYLTANAADGPEGAFDDDFVDLGGLKGNVGNQNYEIPPGTDLTRYTTVVIWCDRFDSAFGAANLA